MGITQNVSIYWHDHNNAGGGVALIINKKFMLEEIVQNYILWLYTDHHQHLCVNSQMNCQTLLKNWKKHQHA